MCKVGIDVLSDFNKIVYTDRHISCYGGISGMDTLLPSNERLIEYSNAVPWEHIEESKRNFNAAVTQLAQDSVNGEFPLELLADAINAPVTTYYDHKNTNQANVIQAHYGDYSFVLGSVVSSRYRSGKPLLKSIVPYNLNPSVNHTNIIETDDPGATIRALGAELELGLLRPDGTEPGDEEVRRYIDIYRGHAHRLGITPQVDREACQHQIEVHVAPGIGYYKTRKSLDGIMAALMVSSEETGLNTAIMSSYPTKSDFALTNDPKVHTAVDLMVEANDSFPEYRERLKNAKKRYGMSMDSNVVEVFRLQGCHIHLDVAGRSEALSLLTFHTMLRSATAIANSAMLKGGPSVNGTCDEELLCTREYLRSTTVTGRHIEVPRSLHLVDGDLERYAELLKSERANAVARGLLWDGSMESPVSAMHNAVGRIRPDLGSSKRICTVESTGMPVNISASRQAAVLTDFEYTHALIEGYFRKYGLDLEPMYEDKTLLALIGPLTPAQFADMHHHSDRECTDTMLKTAAGTEMSLAEFYEMKRIYMHKHLTDVIHISPRDIDDVYMSIQRMLAPPSGESAQTVEQYIYDYKLRSTGNWGQILRNGFIEEGGVPGTSNPEAVLKVVNRVHNALKMRYLSQ